MERGARVATWLDLAALKHWRHRPGQVRVHPVGGRGGACYAVSMDGRWVCTSAGELTVFHGMDAAVRFLEAANIDEFEHCERAQPGLHCDGAHFGLCLGRTGAMMTCREFGRVPEFNG